MARRFDVSLVVAGGVLSVHFFGALLGVIVSMRLLQQVSSRTFVLGAVACLGLGCAGVAVAPSWPAFLGGVLVIGFGFGALDIGCNQLVAHSEGTRRTAVLNALNGAFAVGAVAGPILVTTAGRTHLGLLYGGAALVALALVPLVAGISGRLPFTPQPKAEKSFALLAIFMVGFGLYVGVETGIGGLIIPLIGTHHPQLLPGAPLYPCLPASHRHDSLLEYHHSHYAYPQYLI